MRPNINGDQMAKTPNLRPKRHFGSLKVCRRYTPTTRPFTKTYLYIYSMHQCIALIFIVHHCCNKSHQTLTKSHFATKSLFVTNTSATKSRFIQIQREETHESPFLKYCISQKSLWLISDSVCRITSDIAKQCQAFWLRNQSDKLQIGHTLSHNLQLHQSAKQTIKEHAEVDLQAWL